MVGENKICECRGEGAETKNEPVIERRAAQGTDKDIGKTVERRIESESASLSRGRRRAEYLCYRLRYLLALLIGAAGVGDSVTFDTVGSWTGAVILAVLLAAGGIVCWGYGRGLEIERAEKAQLRRYCRKLKSCQRAAEEKNDRHSA